MVGIKTTEFDGKSGSTPGNIHILFLALWLQYRNGLLQQASLLASASEWRYTL